MESDKVEYPELATELIQLLKADQEEKREVGKAFFDASDSLRSEHLQKKLTKHSHLRARRMLEILDEVGGPSISKIGVEAAQAMSVLAMHSTLSIMQKVLSLFQASYRSKKKDTYYQAIPSLTDWVLVLERKPQLFGTQWLWDKSRQPYLPPVQDFAHVNGRRAEYDIEPLHWPKSLAINETDQPWLKRPLSEVVIREPTDEEYDEFSKPYLD